MEGTWQTNRGQTPSCGNPQAQPSSSREKLRLPTVHDALPFTPLSSIIPFNPEIIQPPTAAPVAQPTAFSHYEDVNKSKVVLDQLSAGASSAENASQRCQQIIRDVQRLLDGDSLTSLTFKKPSRRPVTTGTTGTGTDAKAKTSTLSPFARMVLDNTPTSFHYLTPEHSPEPDSEQHRPLANHAPVPALATPTSSVNHPDVTSNGPPPSSSQQRQVSAVVPNRLSEAQRAEYQYMPDQDSSAGAQYLTPSKGPAASNASRTANLAQRAKSDNAVMELSTLLTDYLQKLDQTQPDTSGQVSAAAFEVFELRDTFDGSRPVLRAAAQSRLEAAVSAVASHGRLPDIELHELKQAQQLCEPPVAAIESLDFSIGDDWTEQDIETWVQQIGFATHGLSASRTLTETMAGCAKMKEMQSEGYLGQSIDALMTVAERCVVQVSEERTIVGEKTRGDKNKAPPNARYTVAFNNRATLQILMKSTSRAMRSLGKLLVKVDVDESIISRIEYLCKTIIFAESATSDKDSPLGVGRLEELRQISMDVYARIFTKYTSQRNSILQDILTSLEKLPATKQSARQYHLSDAKPIQLVSALLMRLVQTSATRTASASEGETTDGEAESEDSGESDSDDDGVNVAKAKKKARSGSLREMAQPLHDAARSNAHNVVSTLIQRALSTTKSSDEPYRKLLDIFTEDFLNVLGSSDWPASELLLRTLVSQMVSIVEGPKSSVPAKTLALELLGIIGAGIIELQIAARHAEQNLDMSEDIANHLRGLLQQTEAGEIEKTDLVALDGPYRVWAEYLNEKGADEKALLQSAHGYVLMQWAQTATEGRTGSLDSGLDASSAAGDELQSNLKAMLLDPKWLDDRSTLRVGTSVGRSAVLVATLNSKLCRAFPRILNLLLASMSSEYPNVRSRSLKSVNMLLDEDPTMLDRHATFVNQISRCMQDPSALVRDSALTLLQRCISLRPKLDARVYQKVIERTRDNNTGVRKRALKMLKDVYLRHKDAVSIRSAIADAVLWRLEDHEESVGELARTTLEEVWFQPLYGLISSGESTFDAKLALNTHAALMIASLEPDDKLLTLLEGLTRRFTTGAKAAKANTDVCSTMITVLFDGIIDNGDIPGAPAQSAILRLLTVYAKATPSLFTAPQLERLEPYTKNLQMNDELGVYRYVLTIFRYVMPHLTRTLKNSFLQEMQSNLLPTVTRLQRQELREVAPCLWTINGMLGNIERLVNFMVSLLRTLHVSRNEDFDVQANVTKVSRLMVIASEFGNACDFEGQLTAVKAKCTWYKGNTVAGLIVETLCVYTSPKMLTNVRRIAIEGICTVSQAWPKQFLRADVTNAIDTAFKDGITDIEEALLTGLEGFFVAQESPEQTPEGQELPKGIASGTERLGNTFVASDNEGASSALAQRSLPYILRIALSSCTESAYIAARLIVSFNKQGLVHPNEGVPELVAFETCPNKSVASAALKEHQTQHQKHESQLEKEYMRAVQLTFDYQSKVVGNALGYSDGANPTARMHLMYEVLKGGKASGRKKFLTQMSQKLNFNLAKLELEEGTAPHLAFVRFCCENLALFDYDKMEDLLSLHANLGKIFSGTGSVVAQAIESEVLNMQVDSMPAPDGVVNGGPDTSVAATTSRAEVDPSRLRRLCVSAQIITVIEETRIYLRRVWNLQKHLTKTKPKGKDKDTNRTPARSTNAPALTEAYIKRVQHIMDSAATETDQRAMCSAFAELISTDNEVKVASDNEENVDMGELPTGYDTPSESSGRKSPSVGASGGGGGRGKKRKAPASSAGGTPKKRGRPRKSVSFNDAAAADGDGDGGWD